MNPKQRYFARRMIMQALYEKDVAGNDNQQIIMGFLLDHNNIKFDQSYFQTCFISITENMVEIDSLFNKYIDRKLDEVDPVTKAILRLATYELKFKLDIPYKVAINEALNLAKSFGAPDSHKFINATLDQVAKEVRLTEK
jgi:N utilization substance protein B